MSLIDSLKKEIHYIESLNSCMNCALLPNFTIMIPE